jgi:hypothetical protein
MKNKDINAKAQRRQAAKEGKIRFLSLRVFAPLR